MAISNNSTGLRPGVCTSTTRPTAPYEGQHIYETDTDVEYVWNGSAWVVNYVSANNPTFTGTVSGITKSMVGLGSVDNTADTAKPVSTAQQTALNLKANLSGAAFTGIVTNSAMPAFSAYPASNYGGAYSYLIPHNTTIVNRGGNYNTSTYTFTAPVAGMYHFSINMNIYAVDASNYAMPTIFKNGAGLHYGGRILSVGSGDQNAGVSASMYLAVGDYVQAYCACNDGSYLFSGGSAIWNSFTGVFLG